MSTQPQGPTRLASEDVIINAPMSYAGSAQRIMRIRRRAPAGWKLIAVTLLAILFVLAVWVLRHRLVPGLGPVARPVPAAPPRLAEAQGRGDEAPRVDGHDPRIGRGIGGGDRRGNGGSPVVSDRAADGLLAQRAHR